MAGYNWKVGQIAFLNQRELLSEEDAAATACLAPQTFGHPMVILRMSEETGHALVTSITAFGSGPHNDFRPPWEHPFHSRKPSWLFRSFEGTERPPARGKETQAPLLCLRDGKTMPKKKTSWVYTRWSHIIPTSALIHFDKSACRLELTEGSLKALINAMAQSSSLFAANWTDARVAEATTTTTTTTTTTRRTTTRTTTTTKRTTMPGTPKKMMPATATPPEVPVTPVKITTPPVKGTMAFVKDMKAPAKTAQRCRSWAHVVACC